MHVFQKLKSKLKQKKSIWRIVFKTTIFRFINRSDTQRWEKEKALQDRWEDRTKMLGQHIKNGSKVFEFGAGNMRLKKYLPKNCIYIPSDFVRRTDEMHIIDLNKTLQEIPKSNYIVFSGVLEYVKNLEKVLKFYSGYTENFLLSYAVLEAYPNIKNRRKEGWISDNSHQEILEIAKKINFNCSVIGNWKNQTLYHLKSAKS